LSQYLVDTLFVKEGTYKNACTPPENDTRSEGEPQTVNSL
jgi:hypothetical protein